MPLNLKGRFELKFLASYEHKSRLLEACGDLLRPDSNGADGTYRVTSQYYDGRKLEAYHEKLDGESVRQKYRLRFYGRQSEKTTYFFEIKHRRDRIIRKERFPLTADTACALLQGKRDLRGLAALVDEPGQEVAEQVELVGYRNALRPTAVITYLRQAWHSELEPNLRVTFDQFCEGLPAGEVRPGSVMARPLHPAGQMILEVKFNGALPRWLSSILNGMDLTPVRFSKYATGMDALRR